MEICANALNRYQSVVRVMLPKIGEKRLVSSITKEDLLFIRKELLTGGPMQVKAKTNRIAGRKVPTVNYYMTTIGGMFQFATDNGYTPTNPFNGLAPLKKSKAEPEPLSREEFLRLLDACTPSAGKKYLVVGRLYWHSPRRTGGPRLGRYRLESRDYDRSGITALN